MIVPRRVARTVAQRLSLSVVRNPCIRAPAAQVSPVRADEVLEDHRPLPAVVHLPADAVDEEERRGQPAGR